MPNTTKEDTSVLKRILAVALAAAMILGLAGVAFAASPFPDTAGIEEEETIALLKTLGLVKGDDLGYFNPEDTITRAEFCAMIVRALGLETAASYLATPTMFPDVTAAQSWAYGYINVAVTRGVINGYPDGTFRPQGPVTQAEALTMVMRALGYKDSLPGNWPLDYIIKGAEVELVEAGFVPNASATRAFVATMIGTMLEAQIVREDADTAGEFDPTGYAFGEYYLKVEPGPDGMVTGYSTSAKTITLDAGSPIKYVSGVTVYGKVGTVSELKGYNVATWVNDKGQIVFVATTSKDFFSGKITAVDLDDETITVAGTEYDVVSTLEAHKNGTKLEGSLAHKLVALVDTTANVWLDADGAVYKIEARILNESATIKNKTVQVTMDGTVYVITFDGGTSSDYSLTLADEVTLSRNGTSAGWSDLKVGDSCDYAEESGEIVWLDAWNQVIKAAQVSSKLYLGSSNRQIVAVVNGVSTTYQCTAAGFDAITSVNSYWDLSINRDGEVYAATEVTTSGSAYGTIAGVSIENVYVTGEGNKTIYKVSLGDGSSFAIPLENNWSCKKNQITETLLIASESAATYFLRVFKIGDGISFDRKPDGTVETVSVYSPVFTGVANVSGSDLTVTSGGKTTAVLNLKGASMTLNGSYAVVSQLDNMDVRITWNVQNGRVAKIQAFDFENDDASAVAAVSSDVAGNYKISLAIGEEITATDDTIVVRDGEAAELDDIELGDKLIYALNGSEVVYIEVESDDTAPSLEDYTVSYNGTTDVLTVELEFDEEVQAPVVWVAGVEYTKTVSGTVTYSETITDGCSTWKLEIAGVTTDPTEVSLALTTKDYAGNVLNATPGMVSVGAI